MIGNTFIKAEELSLPQLHASNSGDGGPTAPVDTGAGDITPPPADSGTASPVDTGASDLPSGVGAGAVSAWRWWSR
jgi:hypothetical protein